MAIPNPYKTYKENTVTQASPAELTLMLYNGALKFIKLAKQGIEEQNIELKNTNIQKTQSIIQELMVTLNTDVEISNNLMRMYDFMFRQLVEANVKNDAKLLDEVEGFLVEFRDTWKEMIQQSRKGVQNGQA
ncbi:flagellar export chaperone FliS [Cytobacillus firmus]|uniref:Flagellar secretion chaperone FliS n=1 Tax=Cytobacillus firmus TaxID=1399 RepID=A0A800NDX9_CYTFI|nr:flagellar export chaperone FliS [Cytobacillus firmus]KAF0825134.1 Flagellar biosynthesis protein FliS [Cytobacillus firmus]MBG9548646.1 flagellar biosynthesis protein FliS [Cytobacillus firmus]MBG9603157.1 flagellar biosynthesis protein FliS [Cytobacillus firmus]MBG9657782.1 flagellar biosynthesis protein FliS [Cytobacillus firmus]MDD9310249.1 flagellar export chaperone FliS [Cytobacillus firmus]